MKKPSSLARVTISMDGELWDQFLTMTGFLFGRGVERYNNRDH